MPAHVVKGLGIAVVVTGGARLKKLYLLGLDV